METPGHRLTNEERAANALFAEQVTRVRNIPDISLEPINHAAPKLRAALELAETVTGKFTEYPSAVSEVQAGKWSMRLEPTDTETYASFAVHYQELWDVQSTLVVDAQTKRGERSLLKVSIDSSKRVIGVELTGHVPNRCEEGTPECIKRHFLGPISSAVPVQVQ